MANIFDKENAALMSFGKVMSRMAAQPLDISEIWYNKTELETYAASDATAYAGQKVTYVDQENNKVYQYSIQTDGTLKEIGIALDEESITVNSKGLAAMFGFEDAETDSVPVKDAETGKLAWKTLEEIGAGDNTTYEITPLRKAKPEEGDTHAEGEIYGIIIEEFFNGVSVPETEEDPNPKIIAFDVYTKTEADVRFAFKGEDAYDDTELTARVKANEDNKANAADVYTKTETDTAIDNAVKGILGEGVDEAYNTLKEIQDILEGTDGETIDGLIETVDANKTAIATLNGDAETEGSVAKQIADAVAPLAVAEEVAETYATKQEITDAGYAVAANVYTKDEVYSKSETDTAIADAVKNATGGESASDMLIALNNYKKAVNREVWGVEEIADTDYTSTTSRIDTLETADTAQDALIASNTELAQKGVDDAAAAALAITNLTNGQVTQNKNDIAAVKNIVDGEDNENSHAKRIAKLEQHDLTHGEEYTALNTKVGENTTAIAKKADADKVYTKSETDALLVPYAFAANVYGKNEVYTKTEADAAIKAVTGEVAADTTLVAMIGAKADQATTYTKDEVDGLIDDLAIADVNDAIKANTDAIAALAGDGNTSTVKKNADDIAAINALLNAVDSEDSITSLKELAIWVEEHETEVLPVINAHSAILAGIGGEGEKATVKAYVDDAIAAIPAYDLPAATAELLGGVKSAADVDGKVVANAVYVDATSNIGSVKAISTDVLVNGAEEFVLYGGNAGVAAEA